MLSDEDVKILNEYQTNGKFHQYTCCGHNGCRRPESVNYGTLLATKEHWSCPCGKYIQEYRDEVKFIKEYDEQYKQIMDELQGKRDGNNQ